MKGPARKLLDELAGIGASVRPAGQQLILRAGPSPIPASMVRRVREAKSDLIAILKGNSGLSSEDPAAMRTVQWLDQNPEPSPPGRCAWCGLIENTSAVVVPFGVELGTHTWLHSECWPAWYLARLAKARLELGIE